MFDDCWVDARMGLLWYEVGRSSIFCEVGFRLGNMYTEILLLVDGP